MTNDTCPHEGDITYGKQLTITKNKQVVQMLCNDCYAVGVTFEQRDPKDYEHWDFVDELWHEPTDYYRHDFAESMSMTIKLRSEE